MMTVEKGIVRPVNTDRTPKLGPMALMVATDADLKIITNALRLPHHRKLYFSRIYYHASDHDLPAVAGPLMGAPYAVMVLETLIAWGVQRICFYGWCGSIDGDLHSGDVLIPDGAIIDEGTSCHYHQKAGDTVRPDALLSKTLHRNLHHRAIAHRRGLVWSTDGIFRETPGQISKFQKMGAVAVEMELSALFSVADFYHISLAAALIVSDELYSLKWQPGFKDKAFIQSRRIVCDVLSNVHRSLEHG